MVLCQGAVISTVYHIGRILTVCAHIQTGLRPHMRSVTRSEVVAPFDSSNFKVKLQRPAHLFIYT